MNLFSFKWMMRVIALIELFMLMVVNLVRISCQAQPTLLSSVTPRPSGEDSILLKRLDPSSLGTTSRNLLLVCTFLVASLSTWVSLRVGFAVLSLSLFRD